MADFETFGGISDAERAALLAKAKAMPGIASANPFDNQEYMARQQALAARLPTATGAERAYVLGNLHPAMLGEQGSIEKFQSENRGENATGAINQDFSYAGAPDPTGRQQLYTAYQRGVRQYIPGLGITQSMGPRVEVGTGSVGGAGSGGGIWGALNRNNDVLRRIGGSITGGALGLLTGNPIMAALLAARGAQSGRAPTGMEVVGTIGGIQAGKGLLSRTASQLALEQLKRAQQRKGGFDINQMGQIAIGALRNRMTNQKKQGAI